MAAQGDLSGEASSPSIAWEQDSTKEKTYVPTSAYKVRQVLSRLATAYPDARSELNFESPWQLLVATMLSAQCTDKRVNMITPRIFSRYPEAVDLAQVPLAALEDLIRDCGLYHTKAKNLLATAAIVATQYQGRVPETREALMELPGVGRKTANVVMANAFGADAIAVDTHVFRVAHRLGWAEAKDPEGTERELMALIPKRSWSAAHHWLILHGRRICRAARPDCQDCLVAQWCAQVGIARSLNA